MSKLKTLSKTSRRNYLTYGVVILAYIILQALNGSLSSSLKGMLVPICAYVVMAVSLNLTVGVLGELSLGHAGFMSMGAFTGTAAAMALQDSISSVPLRLAVAMVIGAVFAAIAGVLIGIPVLRLNGDYLAIVTLAFGEIITKYKLMAFVTSAALAGAAGTLFAMNYSTIVANKFDFNTSILILVFVVLGGLGNMLGSIVAAAALTILPEALRQFSDYRMLVYAIVLILVMLATNNPTLKSFFARLKLGKKEEKEAA